MEKYTDLIAQIAAGGRARDQALEQVYRDKALRNAVFVVIRQNKGNIQDAEDMYQESLIIMDRNIREGKYEHQGNLAAYLSTIARFCWMNQLRKQQRTDLHEEVRQDTAKEQVPGPDHILMDRESESLLERFLQKLDPRCVRIIKLWQEKYSMVEIADQLSLSSEMMARKLKYQCTKKLSALIHAEPEVARILKQKL
jgi:RNA polymerase sigma factor (sigma-70 family)